MMAKEYQNRGGDYNTPQSNKDESQKHLDKWTDEGWQTKEGSRTTKKDDGSRKRYLPKEAWEQMSEKEKKETDDKKEEESEAGKQYVGNTRKAKEARKDVSEGEDEDEDEHDVSKDNKENDSSKAKQNGTREPPQTRSQNKPKDQQKGQKASNSKQSHEDAASKEDEITSKGNQSASQGRKRGRKQNDEGNKNDAQILKKQKISGDDSANSENKTVGSKHDKATPPAKQGSVSRLPKKGQSNVHWKAMPGWVEGEVVEVMQKDEDVDGKNIKASKGDPKVVLKSNISGKICVHKVDNVFFD